MKRLILIVLATSFVGCGPAVGYLLKRTQLAFVVLTTVALLSGCVALGWRFGPGYSCNSGDMFAEPPAVVHRGEEYFLAWTQGKYPFFFEPSYKVMDGRLVFAMAATSSSGNLAGRYREMKIEGTDNTQITTPTP